MKGNWNIAKMERNIEFDKEKLKWNIHKSGFSIRQISEKAGIPYETVKTCMKNGKIKRHNLDKIMKVLDESELLLRGNGWILCEDRFPVHPCITCDGRNHPTIPNGIVTLEMKSGKRFCIEKQMFDLITGGSFFEGKLVFPVETLYENRIRAWLPLPEPYIEEGNENDRK